MLSNRQKLAREITVESLKAVIGPYSTYQIMVTPGGMEKINELARRKAERREEN